MRFKCPNLNPFSHFFRWYLDVYIAKRQRIHRWFAWHPVTLATGECAWMEEVKRYLGKNGYLEFEYRYYPVEWYKEIDGKVEG